MLTTPVVLALVIICLVLSIVIGTIKKVNVGIIALACAWIIGCWLGGNFASAITALFPVKVVLYLITICFFYGFAIETGTMQAIGDRIIYAFRNHVKLLPIVIPFAALIIAGCGGGGLSGVIVMVPIAIAICERIEYNPFVPVFGILMLAPVGGTTFWSVGGVAAKGIAAGVIGDEMAMHFAQSFTLPYAIVAISFFFVLWAVFKGWKVEVNTLEMDKPAPMTKNQKITFWMVIGLLIVLIVPSLINFFYRNPVCTYLANYVFEIQVLCLILGTVCAMLGICEPNKIIKEQIPWNMILVIGGVSTLVAVATKYGAVDMVAEAIASTVDGNTANILMAAVGGCLSLFTDGLGVGLPTFMPMLPTIAESAGVPLIGLFIAFTMGTWITAASPLSTSGGLGLGLCGDKYRGFFVKQLVCAIAYGVWLVLFACTGFFTLFV